MTMVPQRRPKMGRSTASKAALGEMTWKTTMSVAPKMEPAVRPMGRKGTSGNTAKDHHMRKATHPSTTTRRDAHAITHTQAMANEEGKEARSSEEQERSKNQNVEENARGRKQNSKGLLSADAVGTQALRQTEGSFSNSQTPLYSTAHCIVRKQLGVTYACSARLVAGQTKKF